MRVLRLHHPSLGIYLGLRHRDVRVIPEDHPIDAGDRLLEDEHRLDRTEREIETGTGDHREGLDQDRRERAEIGVEVSALDRLDKNN